MPSDLTLKTVSFPPSRSVPKQVTDIQCQSSIVVVGPNGAGKSRLGSWFELKGPQKDRVHRVAAQRSLVFPENTSPIGSEQALNAFRWAPIPKNWDDETFHKNKESLKIQRRYGGVISKAETAPLSDFNELLTLLFSENYAAVLAHEEKQRKFDALIPWPETKLRKVQAIWESLISHRSLRMAGTEVRAFSGSPENDYSASGMSDGERVVFYLVGQCICAPKDSIIVVDEPEIHLHKAIQDSLWNAVEKARQDCTFVYLTHDLNFAADRIGATKICITDYSDGEFSWYAIASQEGIPEDIFLEVLGSRKPILFVEGTNGSHDSAIYRLAYPNFTVKPVGSCASVIAATKVFRSLEDLHRLKSFGIVDRDYLEEGQIISYQRAGIFVPLVAEVENLFLVPDLIKAVANQLIVDPQNALDSVSNFVFEEFERWLPRHAMEMTQHKISLMLGRFSSGEQDIAKYASDFAEFRNQINPEIVHALALQEAQAVINSRDYDHLLRIFNKKDLSKNIGRFFEITKGTYVDKVKQMAKRDLGGIQQHLRAYLPNIEALL